MQFRVVVREDCGRDTALGVVCVRFDQIGFRDERHVLTGQAGIRVAVRDGERGAQSGDACADDGDGWFARCAGRAGRLLGRRGCGVVLGQ